MFLLDAGEAKELIPLKLFYAVYYYCNSMIAYLPIFYEEAHFSKSEIGILLAIPCVCTILAPPLWGAIADSLRRHKHIHVLCYVTSCLLFFSIQFVHSFPLMCVVVLGTYCQMMPHLALMDLAAMKLTTRYNGDFGKQRLYGAFGYGVGGYVVGAMASSVGLKWCFTMMLGVACISLVLLLWYIPASSYGDDDEHQPQKGLLWHSAKQIVRRPDVLALFAVTLVTGINGGFIDGYLFLNVYDLSDNGATIVSVFVAVETLSEIPLFFVSNSMIKRFGSAVCLCIVVAALFIRDMVYIYMEQPWYVIPVETLHGITFGLLLATLTTYLYAAAPKGAAGTMIGLLTAFQRGIGSGIASLAGGYIYDDYEVETIWKIGAFGVVPASLVLIGIFEWFARQRHAAAVELEDRLVDDIRSPSDLEKCSSVQ
ncbi:hypothetical protein PHYBOEH_001132 [Phytophthora boehmeriae]|uniref:Major facilitator superfamily associated domain-containing protein n=1 Tax=Phytophthora boehmeriae TaxID=109152 RepID=A0A8T1WZN0_9STRA|nr:hypothetical protein PHYBOEH_001132 [Phytophthora boehmeriae]